MSLATLASNLTGQLGEKLVGPSPLKGAGTAQKLDRLGDIVLDPLAAGMQILASKPELIPTLPGFRIPGFEAFTQLAQLVGADPGKHVDMVRALETFRGQISDKIASASLECGATAAALTAIAFDVVEKGMRLVGAGSIFGPIGTAIAVVKVIKEAFQRAKQELDRLETALRALADELARDTAAALSVAVPGKSVDVRRAEEELRRHAGNVMSSTAPAAVSEPPAVTYAGAAAPPASSPGGAPSDAAAAAVQFAKAQVGTPYTWGGSAPGGFDCSGLTSWAYRQAGVEIPRVAADQRVGRQVSYAELAPGDLVVWSGHVAMYTGDGMMVEAGSPVQLNPVRTDNIGMPFLGFWRPTG